MKNTSKRLLATTALTRSLTRSIKFAVATGAMVLSATPAFAIDDLATPTGGVVVGGAASFETPAAGTLNIHQSTDRVVINWDSFNIGQSATTQFYQPGSGSLAVNRVLSKGTDPTQILGALKANGRVMVLDRNGVIFGANSRVDVGSIIASTGDVDNNAVMNGDAILQLKNIADGEIVNAGTINVSEAGLAAFVAPTVRNSGVINARLGKVALAAGSSNATVDLYGDGLVEFALDGAKTKALVDQSGDINAEGGTVALSASAAKDVVDDVINMSGVVNVSSVTVKGGKIILGGGSSGKVKVGGNLDASGKDKGGSIAITGKDVEVSGELVALGDASTSYVYGDRLLFSGALKTGTNAVTEFSADDLRLGGTTVLGEGSEITFDPAVLYLGGFETATIVSSMNNNNVTVYVTADDRIELGETINTSGQTTNSRLYFRDGNADNTLQVDLNYSILLGANQRLLGDASLVNVAAYGKIQNGIDVARNGGSVVNVAAGNFYENLVIRKNGLTLNGAKAGISGRAEDRDGSFDETVINADGSRNAIDIRATDVTVDGVSIRGGSIGIAARNAEGVDLRNNIITGTGAQGIYLRNSGDFDIVANRIGGTGRDGIDVRQSDTGTISDNALDKIGQDGIDLYLSSHIDILGNYVGGTVGNGIEVDGATDILIFDNTIVSATQRGISISDSWDLEIDTNNIRSTGRDGIFVAGAQGENPDVPVVKITGNRLYDIGTNADATYAGIGLKNVSSAYSDLDVVISGNFVGDPFEPSDEIFGNGIYLYDVTDASLTGNTINQVTANGIFAELGSNLVIGSDSVRGDVNNIANSGANGVLIQEYTGSVRVLGNNISYSAIDGIRVNSLFTPYPSEGSMLVMADPAPAELEIAWNQIYHSGDDGVHVNSISGGTVYIHDNVINFNGYGGLYTGDDQYNDSTPDYNGGDGIYVTGVIGPYLQPMLPLVAAAAGTPPSGANSTVRIVANTISNSIDDGIEVVSVLGSLFIGGNTINLSGTHYIGQDPAYYNDGYGADAIHVRDVRTQGIEMIPFDVVIEEPPVADPLDYAVIITDNIIGEFIEVSEVPSIAAFDENSEEGDDEGDKPDGWYQVGAGDDGIEVIGAGRTYIGQNEIANVGLNSGWYYSWDWQEAHAGDGIRVRDVYAETRDSDGSFSLQVVGNTVYNTGDDGIHVSNSGRTLIDGNTIDYSGFYGAYGNGSDGNGADGIYVEGVSASGLLFTDEATPPTPINALEITGNTITTTRDDGIEVRGGSRSMPNFDMRSVIYVPKMQSRTLISGNTISNAGAGYLGESYGAFGGNNADGIHVEGVYAADYDGSYSLSILENTINVTGDDGIDVSNSGRTLISGNTISNIGAGDYGTGTLYNSFGGNDYYGADGIVVWSTGSNDYIGSEEVMEDTRLVYGGEEAGDDGWGYSVVISGNDIDTTQDDGIEVVNSGRTLIEGNDIRYAGFLDGETRYGGYYGYYSNDGYGADAIHVRDVHTNDEGYYGYEDDYEDDDSYDRVYEGPGEGYYGGDIPAAVEVISNFVNVDRETGDFDGITADDGVQVLYSGDTLIDGNQIANSGYEPDDEYEGYYGYYGYYSDNRTDNSGADGINVQVSENYKAKSFAYEMYDGYYGGSDGTSVEITNNFVDNSYDDGVEVISASHVLADGNNVDVSGDEGIVIFREGFFGPGEGRSIDVMLYEGDSPTTAIVTNNTVTNSDYAGIKIENYGLIDASFNTVGNTQNVGLYIAGTGNEYVNVEGNTFTDNDVHARFESGLIDLTGASNVFNGGRVGLQFAPYQFIAQYYDYETESMVETVIFQSYLELVDDDAPGVDPATTEPPTNFGGTIGAQIFNGQSQYFVELANGAFFQPGTPTWLNGLNSTYNGVTPAATGGSISPANAIFLENAFFHFLDGQDLGRFWFGQGNAAEIAQEDIFNNFTPYDSIGGQISVTLLGLPRLPGSGNPPSGIGPVSFNDIAPAAGDDNAAPQDVEPAAGQTQSSQNNTSCWADASQNAVNGTSTSFTFSSSIGEDTLAQESSCGSSQTE